MKLLMIFLFAAAACASSDKPAGAKPASYEVNGVIAALPGDQDALLHIAHEEIPDFVGRDGKQNGMPAMTMPFAVGEGVTVSDLAKGDNVRFTFSVNWSAKQPLTVTQLAKID